jgi:hypothetical protein
VLTSTHYSHKMWQKSFPEKCLRQFICVMEFVFLFPPTWIMHSVLCPYLAIATACFLAQWSNLSADHSFLAHSVQSTRSIRFGGVPILPARPGCLRVDPTRTESTIEQERTELASDCGGAIFPALERMERHLLFNSERGVHGCSRRRCRELVATLVTSADRVNLPISGAARNART